MRRLISDRKSGAMFVGFDELVLATPKGASKPLLADVFAFRQGVWLSELLAANAVEGAQTDYLGASGKHAEVRAAQAMMRAGDGAGVWLSAKSAVCRCYACARRWGSARTHTSKRLPSSRKRSPTIQRSP
jgi:hypothetical protein